MAAITDLALIARVLAHRDLRRMLAPLAHLTGVSYLPATVVPVDLTSVGLPVGIQIAGP